MQASNTYPPFGNRCFSSQYKHVDLKFAKNYTKCGCQIEFPALGFMPEQLAELPFRHFGFPEVESLAGRTNPVPAQY